jgi:hypothetical protein
MSTATVARRTPPGPILIGGVVFVAAYIAILLALMEHGTWDQWGGVVILPVLFLVTLPMFARQARRENDPRVFWVLIGAFALKILASSFRYFHVFHISESGSDARQFDTHATEIALRFLDGDYTTGLSSLTETNWMRFFTAMIYTALRPSVLAGFFIYAWMAFLGTYFFYRAFVLGVPDGDRRGYARWLFFMPSILFWPASIGKEAWMLFGLGIAAFGAAKVLRERMIPGILICGLGLGLAAIVRVPFAAIMAVGLVVAGLVRSRHSGRARPRKPLARLASLGVFAVITVVIVMGTGSYLARSGLDGLSVDEIILESADATAQGGSEFDPTPITSPIGAVVGTVTVLFRPFITEAHTPEAYGTAIEASILALCAVIRWRSFGAAFTSLRRVPYIAVALVYTAGSIFMLSAVANFGILVRARSLLFPTFLAVMCFLPTGRARRLLDQRRARGERRRTHPGSTDAATPPLPEPVEALA